MTGQDAAEAAFSYDIPVLLQLFESLGDNCDLGVVQRAVGWNHLVSSGLRPAAQPT